jgi:DNA polymerase III delta prime subunit
MIKISNQKDAETKVSTKAPRKLTLLSAVEQVVEMSSDSNLDDEFFKKTKRYINYLSRKLSLTPIQSVFLSIFLDKYGEDAIYINDLSRHIGCSHIKILQYISDIDELERRQFIRCRRRNDDLLTWRVPHAVVCAFKDDQDYIPKSKENLSIQELFDRLDELFEERASSELTIDNLSEEVSVILEANTQLDFCQRINKHKEVGMEEILLLLLFCHLFVKNSDDKICTHDFEDLYDNKFSYRNVEWQLSNGEEYWQKNGYIENSIDDGFAATDSFRLTDKAKQELLLELNIPRKKKSLNKKGLITCDTITEKQLYYNADEGQQVERLESLLRADNFKAIQERLKANGMRKGFACLFYGAPGTGKTETVYQLARKTGRNIFQVNISEIKSCWVGESEKNIKALFDNYRNAVKQSAEDLTPILLFNEADALINMRKEGSTDAVDKMENAMQNIILQEMETLEGILIATTNLTKNLDRAFERRFLYKIKFTKPNRQAKQAIWQSMIPALEKAEAYALADRYEFSGGQIENIARKQMVDSILYGEGCRMEQLIAACENEHIGKDSERKRIGFC